MYRKNTSDYKFEQVYIQVIISLYRCVPERRHCNASQNSACVVLISPTGAAGQSQTPPSFYNREQRSRTYRVL